MKTTSIIDLININFAKDYKAASKFVNSGELWDFCINTIKNPMDMTCIKFANDLSVPPIQALILIYKKRINPSECFEFSHKERQDLGFLVAYVFKSVLGYKSQQERCTVKGLGFKTATKFLDGEVIEFTD